jgi:hypothetical protein
MTLSLGLGSDALFRGGSSHWEWVAVIVMATASIPARSAPSWGYLALREVRFRSRRRVRWIDTQVLDDAITWNARSARAWCYDFVHRGRLDLTGYDAELAGRLARMVESLAASGQHQHLSVHVGSPIDGAPPRTVLAVTAPMTPPSEWRRSARAALPCTLRLGRSALVVRRSYVRTPSHVLQTLRVEAFSPGRESASIEALSECLEWLNLSIHAAVVPVTRARRLTGRAVHRRGSDAVMTRGAGFRWSARDEGELETLRRRESAVASGAALCQWALYVVVHASTLPELRARVLRASDLSRAAGLRLDPGTASQGEWFMFQLPGGPGW